MTDPVVTISLDEIVERLRQQFKTIAESGKPGVLISGGSEFIVQEAGEYCKLAERMVKYSDSGAANSVFLGDKGRSFEKIVSHCRRILEEYRQKEQQ